MQSSWCFSGSNFSFILQYDTTPTTSQSSYTRPQVSHEHSQAHMVSPTAQTNQISSRLSIIFSTIMILKHNPMPHHHLQQNTTISPHTVMLIGVVNLELRWRWFSVGTIQIPFSVRYPNMPLRGPYRLEIYSSKQNCTQLVRGWDHGYQWMYLRTWTNQASCSWLRDDWQVYVYTSL